MLRIIAERRDRVHIFSRGPHAARDDQVTEPPAHDDGGHAPGRPRCAAVADPRRTGRWRLRASLWGISDRLSRDGRPHAELMLLARAEYLGAGAPLWSTLMPRVAQLGDALARIARDSATGSPRITDFALGD